MTVEDYMSVIPDWAEPHAEAWEEMVRTRWLKMDEDFAAVARRNAENRGDGGTHCGGNLSYERYKGKTRAALGPEEEMSDLEIYNKMRLKKPDLSQPQPSLPEYFGTYAEDVENYCEMIVKELHRQFILLLRLRDGCGLFDLFGDFLSATNNVMPTQGGAAAAVRHRHGLEVEDEGLLKDLIVIFVFLGMLCTVRGFF
ncbi:uncharacterized protein [Lolium perenne]|uniref:uncharacterized protein n=1 Tax=Lolium perenne TaxID=4522 RepID=UPI003A993D90